MLDKNKKQELIKNFAHHAGDTGSIEVQIAILTADIQQLTEHCQMHKHDHSSKRGLLKKVCRRRAFLQYLERTKKSGHEEFVKKLSIKKSKSKDKSAKTGERQRVAVTEDTKE